MLIYHSGELVHCGIYKVDGGYSEKLERNVYSLCKEGGKLVIDDIDESLCKKRFPYSFVDFAGLTGNVYPITLRDSEELYRGYKYLVGINVFGGDSYTTWILFRNPEDLLIFFYDLKRLI